MKIVAPGNIIFVHWKIVEGTGLAVPPCDWGRRGPWWKEKKRSRISKGRREGKIVTRLIFFFFYPSPWFMSILLSLHCIEQLTVQQQAQCQIQGSSTAWEIWEMYHFYNLFSPPQTTLSLWIQAPHAMSLSPRWQVNIHFHPNTYHISSIFDLWKVRRAGDRCHCSFLDGRWCHVAMYCGLWIRQPVADKKKNGHRNSSSL